MKPDQQGAIVDPHSAERKACDREYLSGRAQGEANPWKKVGGDSSLTGLFGLCRWDWPWVLSDLGPYLLI